MVMGEMDKIQKEYTNGEITVKWRPHLCDHSAVCLIKLPQVFDNTKRPWININGASTQEIIDTCNSCPTAALTWKKNEDMIKAEQEKAKIITAEKTKVIIVSNGPVRITGNIEVQDESGNIITEESRVSICRCNKSNNLPYCDGSHRQ